MPFSGLVVGEQQLSGTYFSRPSVRSLVSCQSLPVRHTGKIAIFRWTRMTGWVATLRMVSDPMQSHSHRSLLIVLVVALQTHAQAADVPYATDGVIPPSLHDSSRAKFVGAESVEPARLRLASVLPQYGSPPAAADDSHEPFDEGEYRTDDELERYEDDGEFFETDERFSEFEQTNRDVQQERVTPAPADLTSIAINEIHFHPTSDNSREEWIELHNYGREAIDLAGWQFVSGVNLLIRQGTIEPGGFAIVCADARTFTRLHPDLTPIASGWTGRLSDRGEKIELRNQLGRVVDQVHYADEGDWAVRVRAMKDGWDWESLADGQGRTLELRNAALQTRNGQNWTSSVVAGGTPGHRNSVSSANIAPVISGVKHSPAVPRSSESVTVSARILDEQRDRLKVTLHLRNVTDSTPLSFITLPMFDDGAHKDGEAGDGVYATQIQPLPNKLIIEFYISAVDGDGLLRSWPAAARLQDGSFAQAANALFQVDNAPPSMDQPSFHLTMSAQERYNLSEDRFENSQANATFISTGGEGTQIRYTVGVRPRGFSTRRMNPHNLRVNFASDQMWDAVDAINLNTHFSYVQLLSSLMCERSGVAVPAARAVKVRLNGIDEASLNIPQFGSYVQLEVTNSDWAEHHFPHDANGNLYAARRGNTDLKYYGEDPAAYSGFSKRTNRRENDWSDLVRLTRTLSEATADNYLEEAGRVINIDQWIDYLAVLTLIGHGETSPAIGEADDYDLYAGQIDGRFILIPHDLDTAFGEGDRFRRSFNHGISDMMKLEVLKRFMSQPEIRKRYHLRLRELIATDFSKNEFEPLVDRFLGSWVPSDVTGRMKEFVAKRNAYVLSLLPTETATPQALISNTPPAHTRYSNALLRISGAGVKSYRYKLDDGVYGDAVDVSQPIRLEGLGHGEHKVSVIGIDAEGNQQPENQATVSATWSIDHSRTSVVISELMPTNNQVVNHEGTYPDMIELFNAGAKTIDLEGMRLTDDLRRPDKYSFPSIQMQPGEYLVLLANDPDHTSGSHVGFSLDQRGEGIYLFDRTQSGGRLLDQVQFGQQLEGFSIGRLEGGRWALNSPTPGEKNREATTGSLHSIMVSEWLAVPGKLEQTPFVELFNESVLPVNLGLMSLTDNAIGDPRQYRMRPLTFVAPKSFHCLTPDSELVSYRRRLRVPSARGTIALLDEHQQRVDLVQYGPQKRLMSEGRYRLDSKAVASFEVPSPGENNASALPTVTRSTINVMPWDQVWFFDSRGTNNGTLWKNPVFGEDRWSMGKGILSTEDEDLPLPVGGEVELKSGRVTYYFRTHFRFVNKQNAKDVWLSHFVDDGAVFYLNGSEILRYGMPDGPVEFSTLSARNGEARLQVTRIPASSFEDGENILAVEVHQHDGESSDVVLGVKLDSDFHESTPIEVMAFAGPQPPVMAEVVEVQEEVISAVAEASYEWWHYLLAICSLLMVVFSIISVTRGSVTIATSGVALD